MTLPVTTPATKRRWLLFSFGTLFVVMVVFGCWVAYQLNWIRQRHAFEARDGVDSYSSSDKGLFNAPGLLQFFNEPARATVVLHFPAAPTPSELKDVDLAKRLFPEAETIVRIKP